MGSSAINTCGRLTSAIASITRCRMPPESSWGYARACRAAGATPTRSSMSIARDRALAREAPCTRAASAIWSPTRCTGFSALSGSWNTIARSRPRTRRYSESLMPVRALPASRTSPSVMRPGGSISPMIARPVTLLPEPDSPTTATVSPAATENETRCTACTAAGNRPNSTRRPSTSSAATPVMRAPAGGDRTRRAGRRPRS